MCDHKRAAAKHGRLIQRGSFSLILLLCLSLLLLSLNACIGAKSREEIFYGEGTYKLGFIDKTGKWVIELPPHYKEAQSFHEGLAVVNTGSEYGYIDRSGRTVIQPRFTYGEPFSEGLAAVKESGKWGFIDKSREFVITRQYLGAGSFHEGLATVKVGEKWGYIDRSGKIVIDPEFEEARAFHEGLAAVRKQGIYTFIDTRGQVVITLGPEDHPYDFSEGLARFYRVLSNGVKIYRYVDQTGKVTKNGFVDAQDVSGGMAAVKSAQIPSHIRDTGEYYSWAFKLRWGYRGTNKISPNFSEAAPFHEGLAAVEDDDGFINADLDWGYIDVKGHYVIDKQYNWAGSFSEGLARVQIGEKYGYIDKSGKLLIPMRYVWAEDFSEGLARVTIRVSP